MKNATDIILLALVGLGLTASPLPPVDITLGNHSFPPEQALWGSSSTKEHCRQVPNGLWVEPKPEPGGECIRYYVAGASPRENASAVLFFPGDAVSGFLATDGHPAAPKLVNPAGYAETTPQWIQNDIGRASQFFKRPLFYMARPGVHGSSGEALRRTSVREMLLMNGAVDQIKARYGIRTFHLYGQSGGGTIVGALVNMRSDIGCAVMSSGLLDVQAWLAESPDHARGKPGEWYDPAAHVGPNTQKARLILLSDPRDQQVSYASQLGYAHALKRTGAHAVHVLVSGPAPAHHELTRQAFQATVQCVRGAPLEQIKAKLEDPGLAAQAAVAH